MRFRAIVSYDGTNYYGSQRQSDVNSIQREIERALRHMTRFDISIAMCSRTDKGVHSHGQVFHFDSDLPIKPDEWRRGINKRLPLDIRVLEVEEVGNDFHARFSAKSKIYHYYMSKHELSVFNQNYLIYEEGVDYNLMLESAQVLVGEHDFVSFTPKTIRDTNKIIYSIEMIEDDNEVCFIFHGKGFLKYMIRSIMGNLIDCGKGIKTKNDLIKMLNSNIRITTSKTARASGLYLHKIIY